MVWSHCREDVSEAFTLWNNPLSELGSGESWQDNSWQVRSLGTTHSWGSVCAGLGESEQQSVTSFMVTWRSVKAVSESVVLSTAIGPVGIREEAMQSRILWGKTVPSTCKMQKWVDKCGGIYHIWNYTFLELLKLVVCTGNFLRVGNNFTCRFNIFPDEWGENVGKFFRKYAPILV